MAFRDSYAQSINSLFKNPKILLYLFLSFILDFVAFGLIFGVAALALALSPIFSMHLALFCFGAIILVAAIFVLSAVILSIFYIFPLSMVMHNIQNKKFSAIALLESSLSRWKQVFLLFLGKYLIIIVLIIIIGLAIFYPMLSIFGTGSLGLLGVIIIGLILSIPFYSLLWPADYLFVAYNLSGSDAIHASLKLFWRKKWDVLKLFGASAIFMLVFSIVLLFLLPKGDVSAENASMDFILTGTSFFIFPLISVFIAIGTNIFLGIFLFLFSFIFLYIIHGACFAFVLKYFDLKILEEKKKEEPKKEKAGGKKQEVKK